MKRLVFFRTDMLGDTLLNIPVLSALKHQRPGIHITLVCHPDLAPFMKSYPALDDVYAYPAGRRKPKAGEFLALWRFLSRGAFDMAVVSNARKDLHMAAWLSGIRVRVGYGRKWGLFLTHRLEDIKYAADRHEIEYNMELLRPMGLTGEHIEFNLPGAMLDHDRAAELLNRYGISARAPFVAAHPFSSDPRKCWAPEHFSELLRRIGGQSGMPCVIIGGEAERERAGMILRKAGRVSGINLVGETKDLRVLSAVIQRASVLVGHDSGPVHLAAGVGTPSVTLFAKFDGGPSPKRWAPWGPYQMVLHEVLEQLTVDRVLEAVTRMLAVRKGPAV